MRVYKPISYIRCGDIGIRIDEIISPQKCSVPGCRESECYDIQFEKPDNCSFIGGVFCKNHLECIFNYSRVESEDRDKNDKLKRDTEAVEKFVESDAFTKLMESLDEQDRAAKEDAEQFLRDIKEQEE